MKVRHTKQVTNKRHFFPTVKVKDYYVNFFHQPVKNSLRTNDNILKIVSGLGDDYTTGCLLDYPCFKEHYKMIAINSSKQQELDADAKAIQQINFTGNTD